MFDNNFEVFLADTPKGKEIHYSIRYQVYCEEMGFENKDDFPQQLEYDNDDDKSVHFIVRTKGKDGMWVGAMRLIYKKDNLLPIEQSCKIDEKISSNDLFGAVELSRLCLVKDVRRGFKDIDPPHGIEEESNLPEETDKVKLLPSQRKINRIIIWGLIHAAAEYCYGNRIRNWYFMTTTALAKVLRRGGLNLMNIGDSCQHNGERFPFKMNAAETYNSDIWQGDFNNSYRLFSELDDSQSLKVSSAA